MLNYTAIKHNGVRPLFSTLWSKINPVPEFVIQKSMADFPLIKNNGKKIPADDYDKLHEDCRAFLVKELSTVTNLKTIVVTHHLPTFLKYRRSPNDTQVQCATKVRRLSGALHLLRRQIKRLGVVFKMVLVRTVTKRFVSRSTAAAK